MFTEHLPSPQRAAKGPAPEVNASTEPDPSAASVLAFLASACAVIAATLTFFIALGQGASILALPLIAWAIAPYVALGVVSWRANEGLAAAIAAFIGSLPICGFSVFVLYDAFHAHLDPQSALMFIFLPVWQWPAVGLVCLVTWLLILRAREKPAPAAQPAFPVQSVDAPNENGD